MSSPVNLSPRMSPQPINTFIASSQGSDAKKTEEVAQRTLNSNPEPSTRKRAREGEFQRAPILRLKIPRHRMENSEAQSHQVKSPSERASMQQPSQSNRAPFPQTVSSNLGAPITHPHSTERQSSPIIATPVQPNEGVNLKKFRPLSDKPLKDAQQVIWDNEHRVPVSAARLEYAQKILDEYKSYEKQMIEVPQQVPKEPRNLSKQKAEDVTRAWALVAASRTDATEKEKKRAERLKLYMQKFTPERQTFIKDKVEEITKNQISLEQQENERLREFAEEISQIQSD